MQQVRPASMVAQAVETQIGGHAKEPGKGLGVQQQVLVGINEAQEDLLRDVFALFVVPENLAGPPYDLTPIRRVQRANPGTRWEQGDRRWPRRRGGPTPAR